VNIYSYRFSIILLSSIVLGGITGYVWGPHAAILKPLGEIFLNLMFTIIVPLIFFSVASAIANIGELKRLRKIFFSMLVTFLFTGSIAAIFMLCIVILFPPAQGVILNITAAPKVEVISMGEQIANILTVSDITKLFLPSNILALICFSSLVGLATTMVGEKAKPFANFLQSGAAIFMRVISLIMYYAPIGFFAFFAVLISELGPKLFESYFRTTVIYYPAAILYFVLAFTFYAYLAHRKQGIKLFWKNVLPPAMTALATCSSAASMPVNLQAAKNMQVSAEIYETVIPLGTILHKEGSVLGGVIKISFLFGIFHMNFSSPMVLLTALLIALLVGTVMGAIPSGGMLGEMLILSAYGFPPQALLMIAAISIIIDPLATVLNVTGNTVCSLLVARLMEGRDWLRKSSIVSNIFEDLTIK
jgi:Na+/H+-dicarboxylate symporter